ncbi:hypothetical protein HPP92_019967 [Vanilla planifolia]|uniref:Small ribosomal subunit protein uS10c n=1 Tax=Vanilla planifolia TaxID=51239 RepID=A0A835ULF7_VANPL|nr:hypothetical protein HPP92_019967 [Vanilla planifolia]
MASCSTLHSAFCLPPVCNSVSSKSRPSLSFALHSSKPFTSLSCRTPSLIAFASSELIETQETLSGSEDPAGLEVEGSEQSPLAIERNGDQVAAPKQRIRIKLRSYWVPLIEDSCKQILEAARTTNAKTMGPVPLPTKKRVYCVLKSPHVHKDARFHFEIRTHHRLIDILYPTAQTIDSLMALDLPAGVDVEVKL